MAINNNIDLKQIRFSTLDSELAGDISAVVKQTVLVLLESYTMSRATLSTIHNLKNIIKDSDIVKSILSEKAFVDAANPVITACLHPNYIAMQCGKVFEKAGSEYGAAFNEEYETMSSLSSLVDTRSELLERGETKAVEMAKHIKNKYILKFKENLEWELDDLQKKWNDPNFEQMKNILLRDADACEESLHTLFSALDKIPDEPER